MSEKEKKVTKNGKKQKLVLFLIITLLCLSGVGIFFLMNNKKPEVQQVVYQGEWDVSWYDEKEIEFVITTKEELLGLAELSKERNFKGQTFKLGADIVVNEGDAEDWKEESPGIKWITIGCAKFPFRGVFDGQGHTVSGIYANQSDDPTGMFAQTGVGSEIKNLNIINSYFKMRGDQGVGAVAGVGIGVFSRIYSDAIIDCDGWRAGGIMGSKSKDGSCTVVECWYDGTITITGRFAGGIAGGVYAGECTIQHCHNTGNIISTFPGPQAASIGGIAGYISGRLTISDCFNSGMVISEADRPEVGTILASLGETAEVLGGYNWSTSESAPVTVGFVHGSSALKGVFQRLPEEYLTGNEAYTRTELDFDKYWAVVKDDTPMLQYFAEEVPSTEGLEKCIAADTSWYDVTKTEYIIATPEQLKGFSIVAANGENFYGKVIKLGADIVYNSGKAENFGKEIPLNLWVPVDNFLGTFDGQGHTISGLCVPSAIDHVGMFSFTESKAIIKNFRLVNSYFERSATSSNYGCASIAGAGGGTFEKIYSNAIVVTENQNGGGIMGQFNRNGSISECWFDGEVAAEGRFAGGIVGGAHPYKASGTTLQTIISVKHCLNTGYIHRTDTEATNYATYAGLVGLINSQVTMEDCFNAGPVNSPKNEKGERDELGAITAAAAADSKATIKDCWGTTESFSRVLSAINKTSVTNLSCTWVMPKELLTGYNAVSFTTLNFDKYWSVDLNGTPVLKCFAKSSPSIAGIIRPDVSWYNENKSEFVITTSEQLYGFSVLANSGVTFEGKTVKLGNDITVNTGDASTWKTTAPKYAWFPIKDFAGTFDGQGHTVSGLYSVDTADENIGRGFFTKTVEQTVLKNFRLVNSYFETQTKYAVAAVSARGCGTFQNIYTDAIVNNSCDNNTGGILGLQLWASATIKNCWFAGDITTVGRRTGGIVGYTGGHTTTIAHCLFSGTLQRVGDQVNENFALAGGIVGCAQGTITISDCLSVGKLSSEREKDDAIGSLVGETVKKSTVTMNTSYASESSYKKMLGYNGAGSDVTGCTMLADNYINNVNVSLFTMLDYANYWAVVKGTHPQLKTFASGEIVANPKTPDTSWYSADATSYTISDMEDLYGLRMLSTTVSFKDKVINMDRDIIVNAKKDGTEATTWKTTAPEYVWLPIQNFQGEFNGNGFAISGIYGVAASGSTGGMGLFSKTTSAVNIHDLSVMNSYFESNDLYGIGSIASQACGTFKNIHTNAILYNGNTGKIYMGGIVGFATGELTIEDCWSEANITGAGRYAGGMLGGAGGQKVTIAHCLNSGEIHRFGSEVNNEKARADYGGIIGTATKDKVVTIKDCLNTGKITSDRTVDWDALGSIAGEAPGVVGKLNIIDCYALEGTCQYGLVYANVAKANIATSGEVAEDKLRGIEGFKNTSLDFTDACHWVVLCDENGPTNEYPALEVFTSDENEYDLSGIIRYDTTWFDETTNSGVIMDKWDFYGMSKLTSKFTAATVITLGADIVLNNVTEDTDVSTWKTNAPDESWTPIYKFPGIFDGQGYTISGLYVKNTTTDGTGLFGSTSGGSIVKNVKITKSYFSTSKIFASSVVGLCAGSVENVYSDAIVDTTHQFAGGIIGKMDAATATSEVDVRNCWFAGELNATNTGQKLIFGGIIGAFGKGIVNMEDCLNSGEITCKSTHYYTAGLIGKIEIAGSVMNVKRCMNYGKITGGNSVGSLVGWIQKGTLNLEAAYATTDNCDGKVDGALIAAITTGTATVNGSVTPITTTDVAVTADLTAEQIRSTLDKLFIDGGRWTIKTEVGSRPELDMSVYGDTSWYNTETKTGTITDAEDLFGFAKLAATGKLDATSVITLGNDIVLNNVTDETDVSAWKTNAPGVQWTPIYDFAGTFDGGMHSIKGLYVNSTNIGTGLFRSTSAGSTIKNLKLENSYIKSTQKITGSVIGCCSGNVENVYSDAIIDATITMAGGIVGNVWSNSSTADNPVRISKCWFAGQVNATQNTSGGIVGIVTCGHVAISNCLNTGTITFKDGFVGGILGRAYNASDKWGTLVSGTTIYLSVSDCLNMGTITGTKGGLVASVIGGIGSCKTFEIASLYMTNESDKYNATPKWIGTGTPSSTSTDTTATMFAESALTVQNLQDVDAIKAVKDKLAGFDFGTTWCIGSKGTPELLMTLQAQ